MPLAFPNGETTGCFMWASDNITSKEYYSHLNHPFVFMLFSVTTATSRLSHMSCQRLVTGPVTLCTTSSPKGQGFYSSCIVVVVWVSTFVVALRRWVLRFWLLFALGIERVWKRSCCGKTAETSAEEWEEEEEVANQMQQQGACSSNSSTLTARCEPAAIKGLAPQHKLQRETGLGSASYRNLKRKH